MSDIDNPNHIRQPAKKVDKLYNILSDFQVKSAAFEYRNPGDGYKDIQKAKRAILDWHNKQVKDPFDYIEPCEPDCSPERHAYHQGQWDMAHRMADLELTTDKLKDAPNQPTKANKE